MKHSEFRLIRLNDFVSAMEKESLNYRSGNTPFGLDSDGYIVSAWEMSYRRIGFFTTAWGRNFPADDDTVLINVPPTISGIHPLANDLPYGWAGKINEHIATQAVMWAFELMTDEEAVNFLKREKPSVIFSFIDRQGPGEISVKFNGTFWVISD